MDHTEPTTTVPTAALHKLIRVAAYVSLGRGFIGVEPYPDATARLVLGGLPRELILEATQEGP